MSDLTTLKKALLAELDKLQDQTSWTDPNGEVNKDKAEFCCRRADSISKLAGQYTEINRLQLETARMAYEAGFNFDMRSLLGLPNEKRGLPNEKMD